MIKIRLDQMPAARAALNALDGIDRAVRDGDRERVVLKSFVFTPSVLLLRVKMMNALDALLRERQQARNAILIAISGGVGISPETEPAKYADLMKQYAELEATEAELNLNPLCEADLQLDKNTEIPASVLGALGPLFATDPPSRE